VYKPPGLKMFNALLRMTLTALNRYKTKSDITQQKTHKDAILSTD